MPNKDGTGPRMLGPMSGRGMGPCEGGMRWGRGRGCGYGRGYGFKFGRVMTLTAPEQKKILEAELKEIESEKQAIEARLSEMK